MSEKPTVNVVIQQADFDSAKENAKLKQHSLQVGAVAEFTGCVRADEQNNNTIKAIFLEHYSPMTEHAIEKIIQQAAERWSLIAVTVIHRVGELKTGDNVVYVGAASKHRKDALACIEFVMDFLKNDVPIWKKELTENDSHWVEQKATDVEAKNTWKKTHQSL